MPRIETKTKDGALAFLQKLEVQLIGHLPPVAEIRTYVKEEYAKYKQRRIETKNKGLPSPKTCRSTPEAIFVDEYIIEYVSAALQSFDGMDKPKAANALLYEFHRTTKHRGISTQTCSRSPRSPFTKATLSLTSDSIFKYWSDENKMGYDRASPDFRTRDPFPYKILFEAKYFSPKGSAPSQLVDLIRETFLYRCLPYAFPATEKPEWENDFACAIAYDATEDGTYLKAWESIPQLVRRSFWDGANLYVIILRT